MTASLLRIDQVAALLVVHPDTVLRWIHEERLTAVNISGGDQRPRWRVERVALAAFLRARNADGAQPPHFLSALAHTRPH